MRKYALINDNVVTSIVDYDSDLLSEILSNNNSVIDITDMSTPPSVGWVLNGNKLEIPQNSSDRELFEINLNDKKVEFGISLARKAINRIGARNKILNKTGAQVTALLTQLLGIKSLLETGALGTARAACVQLKSIYTEYSDIFEIVIVDINNFEQNFGL